MKVTQKFSGTFLVEPGPVLRAELHTDWSRYPGGKFFEVLLSFGDTTLAVWNVTDQRGQFEQQPGDYRTPEEQEQHEQAFVERFVAAKLLAGPFAGMGDPK